jgi:uncharacterized protein YndB with AHSA1/START domain
MGRRFIRAEAFTRRMAKPSTIHQSYYFSVPPAKVFAALTDPKLLPKWFVAKAAFTPRKGGTFRLNWGGGYAMRGRVLAYDPPKKVHLAWIDRFEGGRVFETEARFALARQGKGTLLSLTHRGFKSGKKWVALHSAIASGWAYYLVNLKSVLQHGNDLRSSSDSV